VTLNKAFFEGPVPMAMALCRHISKPFSGQGFLLLRQAISLKGEILKMHAFIPKKKADPLKPNI
jgi:hypothetical protein